MGRFLKHFKGSGLKAQMLKGVSGTAGLKVVNIGLTLIIGVLLARTLGPENYGIYTFVISLITLFGMPSKAGLPMLLLRETARNQLAQNWGLIRGLLRLANGFVFIYSLGVAALVLVWLSWGWSGGQSVSDHVFLWALWLLPLIAFEGVRTGTLRGLRWVVRAKLPELLIRPLVLLLLLGGALLLGSDITAVTAMQFNALAAAGAFGAGAWFLFKAMPVQVKQASPEYTIKPWALSLLPLSLFAGMKLLDTQVSIIFLGMLGGVEEVGIFKVAATGATLVIFGMTAVDMALSPQVARLYHAGEMEKLQHIVTLSTRVIVAVSVPIALVLIVWGEPLITLVFGNTYAAAAPALAVLCIGQLVNAGVGSTGIILAMCGQEQFMVKSIGVSLGVNIILAYFLIPAMGVLGASLAFSFSIIILNLMNFFWVKYKFGINTAAFG